MKLSTKSFYQAVWLLLAAGSASVAAPTVADKRHYPQLTHWPPAAADALRAMIRANANQGNFAVFDMDNTSYRYDLEEALLPFLENRGILTRDNLDPCLKLIPFKDTPTYNETLYSYYSRLCEVADEACYPWAAQVWSGFSLRVLKGYVDELMAYNQSIPVTYYDGDNVTSSSVNPPRIYQGQVELYNALMDNGIRVYVMSAASEELVRMVASDPKYGYNVPPENVIGVSIFLRNTTTGDLTTARGQIRDGEYDPEANLDLVFTNYLWTPATWFAGKLAGILTYIDQWKRPVLVAGDTPGSDSYMLFHSVDTRKGGIHLWINRREAYLTRIQQEIANNTAAQIAEGLEVTADKNWVFVRPADIQ